MCYVNFVQSSVLDENDCADTFFDTLSDGQNEQQNEGHCKVKEKPSENVNDLLQNHNEQQVGDLHYESKPEQSTEVYYVLNIGGFGLICRRYFFCCLSMILLPTAEGRQPIHS